MTTATFRGTHGETVSMDHSLSWRAADAPSDDAIASSFTALLPAIGLDTDAPAPRLWIETSGHPSESRLAKSRCRRELDRQVEPPYDGGLRAVLIRHTDGIADFVVVCRSSLLDERSAHALAEACLSGRSFIGPSRHHGSAHRIRSNTSPQISRGMFPPLSAIGLCGSGRGVSRFTIETDIPASATEWMKALGKVICRCMNRPDAVLGIIMSADSPFGTDPGLLIVEAGPAEPHAEPLAMNAKSFEGRLIRDDAELRGRLRLEGVSPDVAIGVVLAQSHVVRAAGTDVVRRVCVNPPYPLTLIVHEQKDSCRIEVCFDAEHADREGVERFLEEVSMTLQEPEISPVDAGVFKNDVEKGSPRAVTTTAERIDVVFERLANACPENIALVCDDERLTYREVNARSNQLAHLLVDLGVERGDFVALCLERDNLFVLAVLAILKAGAVYVPLDPRYPPERLASTCHDAGVVLLITSGDQPDIDFPVRRHEIGELNERARSYPADTSPVVARHPEDPAYVIYTSGSTGRPKGVVVPHRNVFALVEATRTEFELDQNDVWTFFHSCAFDFSVWEIWGCLLTGGRLVVVPYWTSRSPEQFLDLITRERVTVLSQTPSAFSQLMIAESKTVSATVPRLIIFGGETLDYRSLLPWMDRHPESECRLVNMYGITETTVHVTHKTVSRSDALSGTRSVGKPLKGWSCYVLDPQGRPQLPGAIGEIHVGGVGVALGYHRRDELNEQRFLNNPFGQGKLYKTGDAGRCRPDGSIEHLGRLDNQVKLRGIRIELDEIRSVLLGIEGVDSAAVILRLSDPNDPATARIEAYVVLRGLTTRELGTRISSLLPDFMVPGLTEVTELPLTINGKLDERRLPATTTRTEKAPSERSATGTGNSDPGDDKLGEAMRAVWRSVLKTQVGLDDNFFDLGGNSLLAIRLVAALRDAGLASLEIRQLYLHQTIRRLLDHCKLAPGVPA